MLRNRIRKYKNIKELEELLEIRGSLKTLVSLYSFVKDNQDTRSRILKQLCEDLVPELRKEFFLLEEE